MHARSQALARPAFLTLAVILATALLRADPVVPAQWWTDQQLLTADAPTDHDPVTMGQLKNVVWNVAKVLDARFTDQGGCGQALRNTIQLWDGAFPSTPSALPHTPVPRSNFYNPFYPGGIMRADIGRFYPGMNSIVNQGQLKNMAKLVYDRLYELGEPIELKDRDPDTHELRPFVVDPTDPTQLPWGSAFGTPKDYDAALQGQLKFCFSFEIGSLLDWGSGQVIAWGENRSGQSTVPEGLTDAVAVSGGVYHSLALKRDGTVFAWGWNYNSQLDVPTGLKNVIDIAAGDIHNLALKRDGTVVAWGGTGKGINNTGDTGQTTVPNGLNGIIAIAAGRWHSLALRYDGKVFAWGANNLPSGRTNYGQAVVPADLTNVVSIVAGVYHSLAVRADGSVVAWGAIDDPSKSWESYVNYYYLRGTSWINLANYDFGQTVVPTGLLAHKVAAAGTSSLALQLDGGIVSWGGFDEQVIIPSDLGRGSQFAAGGYGQLIIKTDGTVLAWGRNGLRRTNLPTSLTDTEAIAVATGSHHALAIVRPARVDPSSNEAPIFVSPHYSIAGDAWISGVFYRSQIINGPATYRAIGLPTGFSIDGATGIVSGNVTRLSDFAAKIIATNARGSTAHGVRFYLSELNPRFISGT